MLADKLSPLSPLPSVGSPASSPAPKAKKKEEKESSEPGGSDRDILLASYTTLKSIDATLGDLKAGLAQVIAQLASGSTTSTAAQVEKKPAPAPAPVAAPVSAPVASEKKGKFPTYDETRTAAVDYAKKNSKEKMLAEIKKFAASGKVLEIPEEKRVDFLAALGVEWTPF